MPRTELSLCPCLFDKLRESAEQPLQQPFCEAHGLALSCLIWVAGLCVSFVCPRGWPGSRAKDVSLTLTHAGPEFGAQNQRVLDHQKKEVPVNYQRAAA